MIHLTMKIIILNFAIHYRILKPLTKSNKDSKVNLLFKFWLVSNFHIKFSMDL